MTKNIKSVCIHGTKQNTEATSVAKLKEQNKDEHYVLIPSSDSDCPLPIHSILSKYPPVP